MDENYIEIKCKPYLFSCTGDRKTLDNGDVWVVYDHWIGSAHDGVQIWVKEKGFIY